MFLENRQIEIIKRALEDYKFMKVEIENFIERTRTENWHKDFNAIYNFILRFQGTEITNAEDYNDDYGYIDFIYKDTNMCVKYEKEIEDRIVVSKTFEIYDQATCTYVVEDFLSVEEWQKMIDAPKETMLHDAVLDLKYYENNGRSYEYEEQLKKIVVFLKENW